MVWSLVVWDWSMYVVQTGLVLESRVKLECIEGIEFMLLDEGWVSMRGTEEVIGVL